FVPCRGFDQIIHSVRYFSAPRTPLPAPSPASDQLHVSPPCVGASLSGSSAPGCLRFLPRPSSRPSPSGLFAGLFPARESATIEYLVIPSAARDLLFQITQLPNYSFTNSSSSMRVAA